MNDHDRDGYELWSRALELACELLAENMPKCPRGWDDWCPNVIDGWTVDCDDQKNRAAECWRIILLEQAEDSNG